MQGTGRRNAHLLAIAPNANSSIIVSTSPSIEPSKANAYTHRTRAGSHLVKNKYLEQELKKVKKNTQDVWSSIITNGGSKCNTSTSYRMKSRQSLRQRLNSIRWTWWNKSRRQTRIPLSRTITKSIFPCRCREERFTQGTLCSVETRLQRVVLS